MCVGEIELLRFGSHHAAVSRPFEEIRPDERIQHALTGGGIQAQQPGRLIRSQPEAWHFVELGTYALK